MENFFIVTASGPWYENFYNLAFLVSLAVLLYEGYQRKFPMLKWVVLLVLTRLFFITGTKMLTIPLHEWEVLFIRFRLPEATGKSLLGGLLFGGAGLLAGSYLLKFKQNITDAFALVLPLGIAIQRMGCFLTGCCFGKTTALPWAVQYPVNTLPHFHQYNDHLVSYPDALSLPVHPVQLYEMAGLLIALFFLFHFKKKLKRVGNLFLLSLLLIFTIRFVSEFFRDVHAHTIGGTMVGIVNTTQLILLPVILLLCLVLRKREKVTFPGVPGIVSDLKLPQAFVLLLLLSLFFRSLKGWFVFPETVVMIITFFAAFSVFVIHIFRYCMNAPQRWAYFAGFLFPFFLMAQTFPGGEQDSVYIQKYKTIKTGFARGNFENSHDIGEGSGCSRTGITEYFEQKYTLAAVALEFTEINPAEKYQLSYGAKAIMGNHRETRISDGRTKNTTLAGITPYGTYELNWLGVGGGLHLGNLSYITENLEEDGLGRPESGSKHTFIYPQAYVRFGPRRWLFADYHLAHHFPSALPGFRQQIGIGTGLGTRNGTNLRLGFNSNDITYLSGYFPIKNKVVLEPMLLWGKLYRPNNENPRNGYQFSLGVSYRFGFSEQKQEVRK